MKRDFEYHNIKFHLNDNAIDNDFEGRFVLLFWHEGFERWQRLGTCDDVEEAKGLIDNNCFII